MTIVAYCVVNLEGCRLTEPIHFFDLHSFCFTKQNDMRIGCRNSRKNVFKHIQNICSCCSRGFWQQHEQHEHDQEHEQEHEQEDEQEDEQEHEQHEHDHEQDDVQDEQHEQEHGSRNTSSTPIAYII